MLSVKFESILAKMSAGFYQHGRVIPRRLAITPAITGSLWIPERVRERK